jgi:hypothetical protein
VDRDGVFGTSAQVAEQFRTHVDAGISHLMPRVLSLALDPLGKLADEVMPVLRAP